MGGFVLRRVLVTIPVVFFALSLLFFLFFLVPGDPVDTLAGGGGQRAVSQSIRDNIEAKYGLDDPVAQQFGNYWKRTVTGDLGTSYKNNSPVSDIVKRTMVASFRLAFWAICIEVLIGISAG